MPAYAGLHTLTCAHIQYPAGAPAANKTFFCDAEGVSCFSRSSAPLNFSSASATCTRLKGSLVLPTTAAKQLAVEQYFRVSSRLGRSLPQRYLYALMHQHLVSPALCA